MKANRVLLLTIAAWQLAGSPFLSGQESDWDRFLADGDSAMGHKQYAQAEDSYRQAMNYAQAHWKNDARLSGTLMKLAEACNADGKKDEAESLASRSVAELEQARKKHKPNDVSDELFQVDVSAALLTKVGDLFAANERFPNAETLYQKTITIRENYASETTPAKPSNEDFLRFAVQTFENAQAKVADARDKLGGLYRREQKFRQAEEQFRQSEAIREKAFGPDKPPVAQSLSDLAMCYALQGQYDKAEPLYKRVIAILDHNNFQEKPEMAFALENYSLVLRKTGRDAEAKPISERARDIRSKLSETSH